MPEIHSPLRADHAAGKHPDGAAPAVTLREVTGWDLVQAGCWRGRKEALHACVGRALGTEPPGEASTYRAGNGIEILSAAPQRLWCIAASGDPRLDALREAVDIETGCVTELGHSHVRVRLSGPAARHLLNMEIAIDLAPAAFPAGRIARTAMHHAPVLLQCMDAAEGGRFDLYLPHTYAGSLWSYLLELATPHGYRIEGDAVYE